MREQDRGVRSLSQRDRAILRDLASEVRNISEEPVMTRRRRLWIEHNGLRTTYPMMLIFPEGAGIELLPDAELRCEGSDSRCDSASTPFATSATTP